MPNDVNVNRLSVSYIDRDSESSSTSINSAVFVDNATYATARDDLISAFDAVTNGSRWKYSESVDTFASKIPPTNTSFREAKWLVRYEDNTTFTRGSFTIPTADASSVTFISGTDNVDLADGGAGEALKDAIEAFVTSTAGNAVSVISVEYVGRNI